MAMAGGLGVHLGTMWGFKTERCCQVARYPIRCTATLYNVQVVVLAGLYHSISYRMI